MKKQLLTLDPGTYGKHKLQLDLTRLVETRLQVTASSGGGKSFALRQIVEQAYKKTHIIILDPEGEFRTLRPTHDFVVVGGDGDVQLIPRHAATYAQKFLELGRDVIFDLYELEPHQRQAFVRDFLNAMVNAPRHLWHDVLVILDEAHEFAPEKSPAVSSGAVISMAAKGRKRGFALLLATQRPSKLSKDASAECQNKIIGLQNLPDDRKRAAEELGFTSKEELLTLRDMDQGEFYACGPAFIQDGGRLRGITKTTLQLPKTRPPKRGAGRAGAPVASAKLKAELKKLAALPQEAEAEVQTMVQLRTELAQIKNKLKQSEIADHHRDISELTQLDIDQAVEKARMEDSAFVAKKVGIMRALVKGHGLSLDEALQKLTIELPKPGSQLAEIKQGKKTVGIVVAGDVRSTKLEVYKPLSKNYEAPNPNLGQSTNLSICQRKILAFLNTRPDQKFTKRKVATMSGYKLSGSFDTAVAGLNVKGLIVKHGGDLQLGSVDVSDLVKGLACTLDDWIAKLSKCERAIFEILKEHPDDTYTKARMAELTGYNLSGSFDSAVARLHTLGLLVRVNGGLQLDPGIKEYA
ncbi:MAG: DUF87 domain-containing protein [candidate division FCPU426 bacterium]